MKNSSRRDFFRISAGAVGAASALTLLPSSIRKALAVNAAVDTGTIRDVQHVVILMQENRSFDHYFGTLKGVRGFGDRFPIPLASGQSVYFQPDPKGGPAIPPFHRDSSLYNALIGSGTPHNFPDQQGAWNQGRMDQWIQFKTQASMGYFKRQDIPYQFALADAFTLCDSYHCSVLSGTDPNRIFFWSGTNFNPELCRQGVNCTDADSEPVNSRCWPHPSNWVAGRAQQPDGTGQVNPDDRQYNYKYTNTAFKWQTLPDVLQKAGITWRIYQNMNSNWSGAMHGCLAFESFRAAQTGSPLYEQGLTGGPAKKDGAAGFLAQFRQDVIEGKLPQVSWVLPTEELAEHPDSTEGVAGAADFIAAILDALTSNPDVWSKTVLFVTFDENDGFFDHVAMPAVPSFDVAGRLMGKSTVPLNGHYFDASATSSRYLAAADTISGPIRPWGLSSRVPMYVISPWSKGGWVNSQVFDHSSVARFLEKRFDVTVNAISPWHRAVCGDLTSCLDFAQPNDPAFPTLPETSQFPSVNESQRRMSAEGVVKAPLRSTPLFQEPGVRFSRALPYELHASGRVGVNGQIALVFGNTGEQGAVFHVYDQLELEAIPRRYTVESGKRLADEWNASRPGAQYDLWVYGPNGFVRTFKGDAQAYLAANFKPEVQVCYDPAGGQLHVKVRNGGTRSGVATVVSNAYRTDGPWALEMAPGQTGELQWELEKSGYWYDFTLTANGFERRFAGRLETGRPSVSDPAMASHLSA